MAPLTQLPSALCLFASRSEDGVYCAVRRDTAEPSFLTDGTWEFQGCIIDPAQVPVDLNLRVENASINRTGYHLFLALRAATACPLPVQESEHIVTTKEIILCIVILYGLTLVIGFLA